MNMTTKPDVIQGKNCSHTSDAERLRRTTPMSRKSEIRIRPTETASARTWMPSMTGNKRLDSRICVPMALLSSILKNCSRNIQGETSCVNTQRYLAEHGVGFQPEAP